MFLSTKAPTRGLGRATTNFLKHDNTKSPHEKTCVACLSTTSHRDALHFRRASSSSRERKRAEREQLTRLLKESPGKRDARNFLKQFDAPKPKSVDTRPKSAQNVSEVLPQEWGSMRIGVNLGSLYQPTVFTREPLPEKQYKEDEEYLPPHLALVKLRLPQQLDDKTLGGLALTLSQMARLGLGTAVVLDCDESCSPGIQDIDPAFEELVREQTGRLQAALEDYNEPGAWIVDHAMKYVPTSSPSLRSNTAHVASGIEVQNGYLIYPLIDEGVIPIVPPVAYNAELKKVKVRADDILLALIGELGGTTSQNSVDVETNERPVLDRIIVLDPLGGIPSENRSDGAHVFVNLEAEYQDIKRDLQRLSLEASNVNGETHPTALSNANPISKFVEEEIVSLPGSDQKRLSDTAPDRHLSNLDVVDKALKLLPSTSSGLILTPSEAATQAIPDDVRTLPSKNPLLHNMLTDKPMISSSLPTSPASRFLGSMTPNPATFLKKGIPLTMIPDPRVSGPWQPPNTSYPSIDLATDPRVDLPKLVNLINDSFRRTLDPEDYLERIKGRVAGVIVAGDYEGGAICTWESPSASKDNQAPGEGACWVPYLDKFAVLTASQGSGGVSDIVWAALTRSCFPKGLVWRSRTSNPVNKWYQERSTGMWNLPGGQWTMFWTTEGIDQSSKQGLKKWDAYVDVCSGIEPSWADGIKRAD